MVHPGTRRPRPASALAALLVVVAVAAPVPSPGPTAAAGAATSRAAAPDAGTVDAPPTLPGSLGPGSTDVWVDAALRLFLGRGATAADLARWRTVVHVHGPGALTAALAASDEWAGTRVAALYREVLGRDPEPGGRAYWVARIGDGLTLERVAAALHGSEERYDRLGRDPGRFVDALYRMLLEREPDASGRDHWVRRLSTGTGRDVVADAFLASLESRRQRVDALYGELLGRAPDPAGRDHWVAALPALGDVALAATLVASDEHHRRTTGVARARVARAPVGPGTPFPLDATWRPGCPVPPEDLVALIFDHVTFEGTTARGVLIVHRDVADDVSAMVRAAHGSAFPLRRAEPADRYDGDDDASMAADNTSAFNCRTVAGTSTWSRHALGTAVDWNPVENPHVHDGGVDPPAGEAFVDRADVRPGMLVPGGAVLDVVDALGWGWGGRWRTAQDHQHVSLDGR